MGGIWKEIYTDSKFNTAIAAGVVETIADEVADRRRYGPFNRLLIKNRDAVDIQILLDGLATDGFIFEIAAGETLILEPEDGIKFSYLTQKNLDGATAETVDNILFRWANAVRVG